MTQPVQQPKKLDTAAPAREAQEQAKAYDSLFANQVVKLKHGELEIPPHPDFGMLEDEQMDAYEELLFAMDTLYEREDDIFIPEQRLKDPKTGQETGVVLPAQTQPGAHKRPYRINGELVKPAHSTKIVMACLGEQKYKELRELGGSAADVWRVWGKQGMEAKQRQGRSEADGGSVDLEAVPPTDSQ